MTLLYAFALWIIADTIYRVICPGKLEVTILIQSLKARLGQHIWRTLLLVYQIFELQCTERPYRLENAHPAEDELDAILAKHVIGEGI